MWERIRRRYEYKRRRVQGGRDGGLWGGVLYKAEREDVEIGPLSELGSSGCEVRSNPRLSNQRERITQPYLSQRY